MNTLIIYDEEGIVLYTQLADSGRKPVGVPYIEVEIPSHLIPTRVDPVTLEVEYNEVPFLQTQNKINRLENLLADLAEVVLLQEVETNGSED